MKFFTCNPFLISISLCVLQSDDLLYILCRWQPFKRSAYLNQTQERKKLDPQDKKFFEALIKPKVCVA